MIVGVTEIGTMKVPKRIGKEGNPSAMIKTKKMGILFMIIKVRVLSHIDQVFLGCAINKPWAILISQGVF
jgi:hypothetical protein